MFCIAQYEVTEEKLIPHNCADYDHSWQVKVLCFHDTDDIVIMMILFIMVSHNELDILKDNYG